MWWSTILPDISLLLVMCYLWPTPSCVLALEITFELIDREWNEVIFVGERDILLRCSLDGAGDDASIRIESPDGDAITADEACLDYTIQTVVDFDRLAEYICEVSYTSGGERATETKMIALNIQSESPYCFRNGTEGEPYEDGVWLLLSCYCNLEDDIPCEWVSTVVGSRVSTILDNFIVAEYKKKIIRKTIQYINKTSANESTRYDCLQDQSYQSIGPQNASSEDIVINPRGTLTGSLEWGTCALQTTTLEPDGSVTSPKFATDGMTTKMSNTEMTTALGARSGSVEQTTSELPSSSVLPARRTTSMGTGPSQYRVTTQTTPYIPKGNGSTSDGASEATLSTERARHSSTPHGTTELPIVPTFTDWISVTGTGTQTHLGRLTGTSTQYAPKERTAKTGRSIPPVSRTTPASAGKPSTPGSPEISTEPVHRTIAGASEQSREGADRITTEDTTSPASRVTGDREVSTQSLPNDTVTTVPLNLYVIIVISLGIFGTLVIILLSVILLCDHRTFYWNCTNDITEDAANGPAAECSNGGFSPDDLCTVANGISVKFTRTVMVDNNRHGRKLDYDPPPAPAKPKRDPMIEKIFNATPIRKLYHEDAEDDLNLDHFAESDYQGPDDEIQMAWKPIAEAINERPGNIKKRHEQLEERPPTVKPAAPKPVPARKDDPKKLYEQFEKPTYILSAWGGEQDGSNEVRGNEGAHNHYKNKL